MNCLKKDLNHYKNNLKEFVIKAENELLDFKEELDLLLTLKEEIEKLFKEKSISFKDLKVLNDFSKNINFVLSVNNHKDYSNILILSKNINKNYRKKFHK